MKRFFKALLTTGVLFVLALAAALYHNLHKEILQQECTLNLKQNTSASLALQKIAAAGKMSNTDTKIAILFLKEVKRFKVAKAGHYVFPQNSSLNSIINALKAGRQAPIKLTFNNTRTLTDFAGKIAQQIQPDSLELLQFWRNDSVAKSYGFDARNFIGMFLPNTYEVYYTTSAKAFTNRMYQEYQRFWNDSRKQKAKRLGYSPQEISTLAAIVDEETNKNDEKRRIAGVYLNRLKRHIPLQADPTLKFAAGDFSLKRILNIHKKIESPYNTYKYAGLPPSPIRQASISAIDAVLNAEKHDYLYFCAKADFSGYHAFAKALAQHNRNAAAYHRELNKRGIK